MEGPLIIPKWFIVLKAIKKAPDDKRYCQKLNREVKLSFNHLRTIIRALERKHLIIIIPKKKIKKISLTEKGRQIASNIINILAEVK
jgi:predicted transcriptional regulator